MPLCLTNNNSSKPSRCARFMHRAARGYAGVVMAAILVLLTTGAARAEFKLTLDLKDGAKIHDVTKIVAHADSSDGIDKVEFFVDDQLKATATGIPYTLNWDTIADKEGKHTLAVTAYDANGQTKKLTLSLEVDNELGLGAEALAMKAQEALTAGDTATAANYSRRSLKAEPDNLAGSRVIAAMAARDSDWEKAASVLEKASGYDSNAAALHELASYRLHRALLPENSASIASAIQSYSELRRKAADINVSAVKAKDAAAHEAIGDALLRAGHYKEAQLEYQKLGDNLPISTSNRLALAFTLQDQIDLAIAFVRPLIQEKKADNVTRAIYGLALLRKQKFAEARAAVAEDLTTEFPAALIVAAYVDVVNGQAKTAAAEAEMAVKLAPNAADAHYLNSMVIRNLSDSELEIIRAITISPFESGPYLDYAARIALQKQSDRVDDAIKLTEFLLKSTPDDVSTKLTQVLLLLAKGRSKEAEPILDYQMRHTIAPDVQMVAAVYLTQTDKVGQATQCWEAARKMDSVHFDFLVVPTAAQYLQTYVRKQHYRGNFFLSFESLFPVKQTPKADAAAAAL